MHVVTTQIPRGVSCRSISSLGLGRGGSWSKDVITTDDSSHPVGVDLGTFGFSSRSPSSSFSFSSSSAFVLLSEEALGTETGESFSFGDSTSAFSGAVDEDAPLLFFSEFVAVSVGIDCWSSSSSLPGARVLSCVSNEIPSESLCNADDMAEIFYDAVPAPIIFSRIDYYLLFWRDNSSNTLGQSVR